MCTKTKTTFGCGHCIKSFEDCGISACTTVDKWKLPKHADCPQCKAAGATLTRGKDGRGRHGRELVRTRDRWRSPSRSPSPDVTTPTSASSTHLSVSPWATTYQQCYSEKEWDTPTRQKADDAWLAEHERRMSDLEEKTSKLTLKTKFSRRSSPTSSYERIMEIDHFDDLEEWEGLEDFEEPRTPTKHRPTYKPRYEYEPSEDSQHYYSTPRQHSRKVSHDSSGSMPRYQESPRARPTPRKTQTFHGPPASEVNLQEIHETKHRCRPRRTMTEPYHPPSCCFDTPISSPILVNGPWIPQYEMIQPLHHEHYYPRTYPVY
ncbi:hypothetical protein H2198_002793 [Neophaeococcomyces mojaviensis]|uniref:Uncharacterized protein n=1 Tax=Neophaeococcomyces mojaviensis TaxID=3383035 RepID=A0ACC3AD91_9EURO|nr:hypothetical protein H2198_002793 [Knufia sp. JES_112]